MKLQRRTAIVIIILAAAVISALLFGFAFFRGRDPNGDAVDAFLEGESGEEASESEYTCDVPILMYHNIDPVEAGDATVTTATFRAQLEALAEAGYTTVTLDSLCAYVTDGVPLPENPIVITFDDGYMSNYEYAFPILKEQGMCATIFVIGYSFGRDTYKDTGVAIIPHFGEAEATEMVRSGVIDLGSHTYDMHASEAIEGEEARVTVAALAGESESDYVAALEDDIKRSKALIESVTGESVTALAYPRGYYNPTAQSVFCDAGIRITLTTEHGKNTLVKGDLLSLLGMKRFSVGEEVTPDGLIEMIK